MFGNKNLFSVLILSILLLSYFCLPAPNIPLVTTVAEAATSSYAYLGTNGKLEYKKDNYGNTIPDFSNAGYKGGGVRLPIVPTVKTISPISGDNTNLIQNAINEVTRLPIQANGYRGALLLKKGTYPISGSIKINKSGIVLRGEGDSTNGTIIKGTGTSARTLIAIEGVDDRKENSGTRQKISDSYVPVGAHTFSIPNGSTFHVGDQIIVYRPSTQNWLDALGMDDCYTKTSSYDTSDVRHKTCLDPPWTTSLRKLYYDRIITKVEGNKITIDAPIVNALDQEFGGGYIYKYSFAGRIQEVGVENIRGDSTYISSTDENHALRFIYFKNIQNGWIQHATAIHFYHGLVFLWDNSKWITVQDSKSLDPISRITGGRRYLFDIGSGELSLIQRCSSTRGRHDYVTGADVAGPNVFLDCTATNSYEDTGPHQRYATGTLYDNIKTDYGLNFRQRNLYFPGNSHGWAGVQQVAWNCETRTHIVMSPISKIATNWSIGCISKSKEGNGIFDSYGTHVTPRSLYLQQLKDRLGQSAVDNISANPPTITATPTPTQTPIPSPTVVPTSLQACSLQPTQSEKDLGELMVTFNVAKDGEYRVWARMMAGPTSANSFYLKIDNNCPEIFGKSSTISASSWSWIDYINGQTEIPYVVNLTKGSHFFTIIGRETGVKIDRLLFANVDAGYCTPVKSDDLCLADNVITPTIIPVPTRYPTLTPLPSITASQLTPTPIEANSPNTNLSLLIFLHGIGKSGDNANPNAYSYSNQDPMHPTRRLTIYALDTENHLVSSGVTDVRYNSQQGAFSGTVSLDNLIDRRLYKLKVKMNGYLIKEYNQLYTTNMGKILPQITLITGDANNDNRLDILDYSLILDCLDSSSHSCEAGKKQAVDFTDNGQVDIVDLNLFSRELSVTNGD